MWKSPSLQYFSINLDAIALLEARRQQTEAKYHKIYQPKDNRSQSIFVGHALMQVISF